MTKLEMLREIYDDYRTDNWWKRMIIKEYGSLEKYAKSMRLYEVKDMYERFQDVD